MADVRYTLAGGGSAELVVRRSRFLAHAARIEDAGALAPWLAALRRRHPEARHCPHAWVAWDGSSRTSDDGEPSGTGGRPCLGALGRTELRGAAVAVARVFGGVQLGAANLGRAYAQAADMAVTAAGVVALRPWRRVTARVAYGDIGGVESALAEAGATDSERVYGDEVRISAWVPAASADRLPALAPRASWVLAEEGWR